MKTKTLLVLFICVILVAVAFALLLNIGESKEYVCLRTWNGTLERAVVLDSESERSCGLNCVSENIAIFVWKEGAPRTVTFINNLNKTVILVYHAVNDEIHRAYKLYPGDIVTIITVTDRDYFIETRGEIPIPKIQYEVCR